ncbi:MAG: glycosyltransferase family 4 protein, partial [Bdellovibrionales bacterium]|nr:glycosyltransferase family 4 protein [Oligoflexia bacterium]
FIGGLERMILNLSKSLKESSVWQPQVLAYDFAPVAGLGTDLISSFQSFEIPVQSNQKPGRFSWKTVAKIAGHASKSGVTVIHTHDLGALIYGALAKFFLFKRVRLIHTQHSFVHLNRSWKYRYYEKFFTLFADSIAVVSPDTQKSYLQLGVPESKLHVIPNGVDFPSEPDLSRAKRIAKREALTENLPLAPRLQIHSSDFWILYLARIHGRKGQDHALKLWAEMTPELRKSASLIFVGPETDPGEQARLEQLISETPDSNRIMIAGASQSPHEWIKAADLFLSSSEFEGMPLAPVEALGSGIPAVLSRIPGHEFLENYASLYPLSEPALGAKAVEFAMESTLDDNEAYRLELWEKSKAIRKSFTLSIMSKRYEKLYESGNI